MIVGTLISAQIQAYVGSVLVVVSADGSSKVDKKVPFRAFIDAEPITVEAIGAHKADGAVAIARDGNDLPRQASIPLLTAPAHRNASRALALGISADAIADGVEDDVGVVGGGGPGQDVGLGHATPSGIVFRHKA